MILIITRRPCYRGRPPVIVKCTDSLVIVTKRVRISGGGKDLLVGAGVGLVLVSSESRLFGVLMDGTGGSDGRCVGAPTPAAMGVKHSGAVGRIRIPS